MNAPLVTSTANPLVKELASLSARRTRDATGTFLVEGSREASRALSSGLEIDTVIVCPELADPSDLDLPPEVRLFEFGREAFARISRRQNPDGVALRARTPDLALPPAGPDTDSLLLIAEGIEKPGNLGAMVRSCEAFGATRVVLADPITDPFHPNAVRASQGAIFATPIHVASTEDVIEWLGRSNVTVVAGYPDRGAAPWDVDLVGAVALVVGAEATGLTSPWEHVAQRVTIPIASSGGADSFNTAATAGLLLYEVIRQRSAV